MSILRGIRLSVVLSAVLAICPSSSASEKAHFSQFSAHSPVDANAAFSIQPQHLLEAYTRLQPRIDSRPPVDEFIAAFKTVIGVEFSQLRRLSYSVEMPNGLLSGSDKSLSITAVADFEGGIDIQKLGLSASDFLKPVAGSDSKKFELRMPGDDVPLAIVFEERGSLIITTASGKYAKKPSLALIEFKERAKKGDSSILLSLPMTNDVEEFLQEGIPNFRKPTNVVASIDLKRGAQIEIASDFPDERAARDFDQFLSSKIDELIDALSENPDSVTPVGKLVSFVENIRQGKEVQIEMRLTEALLGKFLSGVASGINETKQLNEVHRSKRDAQNLASVSASALAAGATLDPKATTEQAIRKFSTDGVTGTGIFEDTQFKIAHLSDADIAAAALHLEVDPNSGNLVYKQQPKTSTELANNQRFARSKRGGKRKAQYLASVYVSAMAAGADLSAVKSEEDAILLLVRGVKGGGSFDATTFQVMGLDAAAIEAASEYLQFEEESGMLIYISGEKQVRNNLTPRETAQNFAAIFSSARAAGSPDLDSVDHKMEALKKLSEGVVGGGAFSNTTFIVPDMTQRDIASAAEFLVWNATDNILEFKPR